MEDLIIEQNIEKYPYLKDLTKYTIFTSKEDVEKLKNGDKINIDNQDVSIEFLKRILNNDLYFEYALKYFKGDINTFQVTYIINGDTGSLVHYKKNIIIKAILELMLSRQISLKPEEQEKLNILKNSISFKKFLEKNKEDNYNIYIDGIEYFIPVEQIISFMQLPNKQFDNLCSNVEIQEINGVKREYFIYAAFNFFRENEILEEYLLPDIIIDHYNDINSLQKIDLQAINKHLETTDTLYRNVQIDNALENKILSLLPADTTLLEKAIYIYIKMCKLLTYDDEYYAVNQKGYATLKHKDTNHVSAVTPENNKVVCYEFNLIYTKLLDKLGIHFSSNYKSMLNEKYGSAHVSLDFRVGKFLVMADSVTSILLGDIMQAKLNQPLSGIKCINRNLQTQQEFKESLSRMYQLIASQEKNLTKSSQVEHTQTLDELLDEYSKSTDNIQEISLNERLAILIDKVNSTEMVGIDSLSYIIQLEKILFTPEQKGKNIAFSIVRNNIPTDDSKIAMASAIFTLNEQGFQEKPDQNIYYYFNPNSKLISITKEELQNRFNDKVLEYILEKDPRIPGIKENGELIK
ncbi:hypothetical protein EGP95_04870 [bacterium]|nr:hypothetical protein [bacterium]